MRIHRLEAALLTLLSIFSYQYALGDTSFQDSNYSSFAGDWNGDGQADLLLRGSDNVALVGVTAPVPIRIGLDAESIVVISQSDGSYDIDYDPTVDVLNDPIWTISTHELLFGDVSGDGIEEMVVRATERDSISFLFSTPSVGSDPVLAQNLSADVVGIDLGSDNIDLSLVDSNNDGLLDMELTDDGELVAILFGNNNAMFAFPEIGSLSAQMLFEYEVRTGDFDGNGYQDILLERLSSGSVDGSLQTTILEQDASGFTPVEPTSSELNTARGFPQNQDVEVMSTDQNFDGWADAILTGIGSLSTANVNELIVYPSGIPGIAGPVGVQPVDETFKEFFGNLEEYRENPNFFADNLNVELRPVFVTSVECESDAPNIIIFRSCRFVSTLAGFVPQLAGDGFLQEAFQAVIKINEIWANEDFGPARWKELSDLFKDIIGVPSYGFRPDGSWLPTNLTIFDTLQDHLEEANVRLTFAYFPGPDDDGTTPAASWPRHMYDVNTSICDTTANTSVELVDLGLATFSAQIAPAECTLQNVYCWAKKNPAPRQYRSVRHRTVKDGERSILWYNNPIATFLFPSSHVLSNSTLPGHIFHDPDATSDTCGEFATWQQLKQVHPRCSFVHRDVSTQASDVVISTRGEGHNANLLLVAANEEIGERTFSGIDRWIRRRLAKEGSCTDDVF
ncbi:MAG: VCBS repeat-containing protein [Pseudomonadota bacterium]